MRRLPRVSGRTYGSWPLRERIRCDFCHQSRSFLRTRLCQCPSLPIIASLEGLSPNIDDRPTCSKCNIEMLRGIAEPIVPGYELRNFECPSCGDKLKLVGYEGPIKTMSKPE